MILAVCADDYGVSDAVCRSIVELAARGRLSAVSSLVTATGWRDRARELAAMPAAVLRGLHFNLTDGQPASAELQRVFARLPGLSWWMGHAALGRLPRQALREELRVQFQQFVHAIGRVPDFIDGHQHIHHLPGVRESVLEVATIAGAAVRNTGRVVGPGFALKRWAIMASGGRALQRELARGGIAHNAALCGVYDFVHSDYRALVRRWMQALPAEGTLMLCHPGDASDLAEDDPIAPARVREATYLGSAAFSDDLAEAGVTIGDAWARQPDARSLQAPTA